jgi:hypothetical protein
MKVIVLQIEILVLLIEILIKDKEIKLKIIKAINKQLFNHI